MFIYNNDIEEYIDGLLPWMKPIFNQVRMLLLTFPEITEKMRYRTPFYDCEGKMMLYLGSFKKKRFVLAFVNGNKMQDEAGMLKHENQQSQIRHWEFYENQQYDEALLVEYITDAINLNFQLTEPQHVTTRKKGKRN
jgi:hypothetical protein